MYGDRVYGGPGSQYQSHYRNHYTSSATSSPISSRKFYHDKSSSPSTERLNGSFNRGKDGIFRPKSLYSSATEIDFDSAKASFPARSVPITIATNPRLAQIRARHREDSIPRQISRDYDYPSLSPSPRTRSHTLENKSNYNSNFNDNLSYLSNASRVSNSNYSSTSSSSYYPSRQRSNYVSRYPAYNFTTNLYSAKVRERPLLSNLNQKYGARKQSTSSSRNASISSASSSHTNSVSSNEPARPALERNKFLIKFRENNINQSSERRRSSISWDIPGSFAHTSDKPSARAEVDETINENEIEPSIEPSKLNINAETIDDASANDNKLARWNGSMSLNVLDNPNLIEPENKLEPKLIKDSVIRTINCFDICTSQELKHELKLECKKIRSKSEKIKKKKKKIEKEASSENATELKPETKLETKPETKPTEIADKPQQIEPTSPTLEDNKKAHQIFETKKEVKDLTLNELETKESHKDGVKVKFDLKPTHIKAKSIGSKLNLSKFEPNQIAENLQTKAKTEIKSAIKPHIKTKLAEEATKIAQVYPGQVTGDKIKQLKIDTVEIENVNQGKKEETNAQILSAQTTEIKSSEKSQIKEKSTEINIFKIAFAQDSPVGKINKSSNEDKVKNSKFETKISINNKSDKDKIENVATAKTAEIKPDLKPKKIRSKSTTDDSKVSKIESTNLTNQSKIETSVSSKTKEIKTDLNYSKITSKSTADEAKVSKIESTNLIDKNHSKIENIVPTKTTEIKTDLKPKKIESATENAKVSKIEIVKNQSKIETSVSNETKEIKTDLKSSKITSKPTAEDAKVSKIESTNLIDKNHSKIENIVPTKTTEIKTELKPKKIKSATENAKVSKIEIVKNQSKIETPVLIETKEIKADLKSSKITSISTADDAQVSPASLVENNKNKIENNVPVKTTEIKADLKPNKIKSKSTADGAKDSKIKSTNLSNQSKIETSVSSETKEIKTDLKSSKIPSKPTANDASFPKIESTVLDDNNKNKIENIVPAKTTEIKPDLEPKKIKSATENAKFSKIEIVKNQSKIETPVLIETKEIKADLKSSKITSKSTVDDAQISTTNLVPKIESTTLVGNNKIENAVSTKTTEIKVDLKPKKIKSKSTTEDNKVLKIVSTSLIDNNESKIETNEIKASLKPSKIEPKSSINDVKISKVESTTLVDNVIPIKTAEIKTDLKQKKIKSKSTMEDNKVFKIISTTWVDNNESKIEMNEIKADVKLSKITPKSSINDVKVPKIESTTLVDNIVLTKTSEIKVDRKDNKVKSKSTMEDKIVSNIKSTNLIENTKQVELKSLNTTSSREQTTSELCKTIKPAESKISKTEPEQVIAKKVQTVIQPVDIKQTEKVIKPEKSISTNKIENKSQAILSSQKTENKVSKLKVSKELKSDSQQASDKILNGEAQFSPTKSLFAPNQLPAKSVSLNVTIKDKNNNDLELVQEENLDDIETVTLKSPKTPLSPIKSPFDLVSKPELVILPKKLAKQQSKDIETKETPVQVFKSKSNEINEKSVIISQEPNKNVLSSVPICEPLSPKSNLVPIPAPSTSHQSVTVKKDKASTSSENYKKDSSKKVVKKKKKIKKSPTDELSANLDKIVNEPTIIEELRKSNETLENRTNQCAPSPISTSIATTNSDLQVKLTVPIKKQPQEFVDPYRVVKKPTKKIRFREYSINDFTFLTVLGRGSFGKVLLAELRDHGVYFAIKCLKKQTVIEDDDVESIMIERKVLAYGSNNPFICKLFATFQTESHLFFAMEFCSGGDLMFHVQKETKFSEDKARFYACEILCALSFLHKRSIIYRDLKLDNIIVYKDGHTRLVDFGMCQGKIYREEFLPSNFCGTPEYMAPEIIKGVRYNQSVDFWAFGVVIYEMCVGTSPFQGTDEDELLWNVCHQEVHYPRFLSDQVVDLISLLLKKDPQDRLGPADCKYGSVSSQQWFHKVDWKLVEQCKIKPPFIPQLMHETDVSYFDRYFTKEEPCISPSLTPISLKDQELFNGFNYTNHHMTE